MKCLLPDFNCFEVITPIRTACINTSMYDCLMLAGARASARPTDRSFDVIEVRQLADEIRRTSAWSP